METRRTVVLNWTYLLCLVYSSFCKETTGVDIGFYCNTDAECRAGNGGEYSKCNKRLSTCICTVTTIGQDKCKYREGSGGRVCKRKGLFEENIQVCALECSAKGTWKWSDDMDWYGKIPKQFSSIFVPDKKTSACFDPERAVNSLPEGLTVKESTIPEAGLGVFTDVYIQRDTIFGPYKGIIDYSSGSAYSWGIFQYGEAAEDAWIDGTYEYLSNWMRYVNMPTSTEMENIVPFRYKGEIYYRAFKGIAPGTELFVWYGSWYAKALGIKEYELPNYEYAKAGYAGGSCAEKEGGKPCQYDKNTICEYEMCLCVPGTRLRCGFCIQDETLGGKCNRADGETCRGDEHAECQGGVCVCKNYASPANGECIPDETAGGRCSGLDGEACLLDNNTDCVDSLCYCKYGTSQVGRNCQKDEIYKGMCNGEDGSVCRFDHNAECQDGICVCRNNTSEVNGECKVAGQVGGRCTAGKKCVLNKNLECVDGLCVCKQGSSMVNGTCLLGMDPGETGGCTGSSGSMLVAHALCAFPVVWLIYFC